MLVAPSVCLSFDYEMPPTLQCGSWRFKHEREHIGNTMSAWPNNTPPDLRRRLNDVIGRRSFGAADLWGEVKEWLELHGVQAPDRLPEEQKVSVFRDQ